MVTTIEIAARVLFAKRLLEITASISLVTTIITGIVAAIVALVASMVITAFRFALMTRFARQA